MKKLLFTAAAALMAVAAFSQEKLTYSLPRTSFEFEVTAVRTDFTAGPYAQYASKYLGLDVRTADEVSYAVSEVRMRSFTEADPDARFSYKADPKSEPVMLQLTSQGLVASHQGTAPVDAAWKFPSEQVHEFLVRPANLTNAKGTLYYSANRSVKQDVVVEKSGEAKAAEVAGRIFAIRENKYKILVGDTDATYSGEAMKAAIDALDALEAELLSLFTGSSSSDTQQAVFELVPSAGAKDMVAFRLSSTEGFVPADDLSGTPYFFQIEPESLASPAEEPAEEASKGKSRPQARSKVRQFIHYRVPAVCRVTLGDGEVSLLSHRALVWQCGTEEQYPIY